MRIKFLILLSILLPCLAFGEFLGIKKSTESISMRLKKPIDSAFGIERKPDSGQVFSYGDDGTTILYSASITFVEFGDSAIDSIKHFSDTEYVYIDDIVDIDGGGGNNTISVWVRLFTGGYPTTTSGIVQVISDSLNIGLPNKWLFANDSVHRVSNSECDTILYINGSDTVLKQLYWHVGGAAGDAPTGIGIEF